MIQNKEYLVKLLFTTHTLRNRHLLLTLPCFQHGLPTRNPGSYCPFEDRVTCKNCEALQAEWRDPKSVANQVRWAIPVQTECQTCKKERARRCIVISQSVDNQRLVQETPFTEAPYVSPFRYPSNHAQHLRAIQFAKAQCKRLYWITAYDAVQHDAADFKGERGEKKKDVGYPRVVPSNT